MILVQKVAIAVLSMLISRRAVPKLAVHSVCRVDDRRLFTCFFKVEKSIQEVDVKVVVIHGNSICVDRLVQLTMATR